MTNANCLFRSGKLKSFQRSDDSGLQTSWDGEFCWEELGDLSHQLRSSTQSAAGEENDPNNNPQPPSHFTSRQSGNCFPLRFSLTFFFFMFSSFNLFVCSLVVFSEARRGQYHTIGVSRLVVTKRTITAAENRRVWVKPALKWCCCSTHTDLNQTYISDHLRTNVHSVWIHLGDFTIEILGFVSASIETVVRCKELVMSNNYFKKCKI